MLKECLSSIISQTFLDYEVIIGNDYTGDTLSAELFGIDDPSIRFVNHPLNLGELGNANSLLGMSQGRYFTWLADDDMYASTFLQAAYAALTKFNFPPCVFTSYIMGDNFPDELHSFTQEGQLFDGNKFLHGYLSRRLKTLGCYGFFDAKYLKQFGGMEQLGVGFSPYSDNLLAIRAGLLEKVAYIDAPLIFFRTHGQSISLASPDIDAYSSAQIDLMSKCMEVFRSEGLRSEFHINLFLIIRWCMEDWASVLRRSGRISGRKVIAYLLFIIRYISFLKGFSLYCKIFGFMTKTIVKLVIGVGKDKLKALSTKK